MYLVDFEDAQVLLTRDGASAETPLSTPRGQSVGRDRTTLDGFKTSA